GGGITSLGEPEWDLETNRFQSLKELSKALGGDRRRVCRGYLRLGYLTDELHTAISRVTPQEDEVDFTPDTFSLHIEPIECVSLSDEQSVRVGWIAAAISGDGYLFPWTLRDAVSKLESRPELKALMELCRTTWPLNNDAPDEATVKVRREIGGLWPYTDFRKPWDWYWGCAES
ncbi:MAG TPA: hypothetical protein VGE52_10150, partial [Pirellulales bacterium]